MASPTTHEMDSPRATHGLLAIALARKFATTVYSIKAWHGMAPKDARNRIYSTVGRKWLHFLPSGQKIASEKERQGFAFAFADEIQGKKNPVHCTALHRASFLDKRHQDCKLHIPKRKPKASSARAPPPSSRSRHAERSSPSSSDLIGMEPLQLFLYYSTSSLCFASLPPHKNKPRSETRTSGPRTSNQE